MRAGFDPDLFEPLADVEERSFWFRARNRLIVSTFRRHFPDAGSLLEVGCGGGFVLGALREAIPELRLVGVELYAEGLAVARRRLPERRARAARRARTLPYESEFDVVGAFDVLEHVEEDEAGARADGARGCGRAAGSSLLVPQHPWLWSEHDEIVEHRAPLHAQASSWRRSGARASRSSRSTSFVTLAPAGDGRLAGGATGCRKKTDPIANLEPGPLNGVFERMLDGERKLIERGVSLPFGGSLMLVGRKR